MAAQSTEADFAIVTIPPTILERIPNDFSPAKQTALKKAEYFEERKGCVRIASLLGGRGHLRRRRLDRPLERECALPRNNHHGARGVIVGAYVAGWTHAILRKPLPSCRSPTRSASAGSSSKRCTRASHSCSRVRSRSIGVRCLTPRALAHCGAMVPPTTARAVRVTPSCCGPRPDRLRRRAFVLRRPVAGRSGALRA